MIASQKSLEKTWKDNLIKEMKTQESLKQCQPEQATLWTDEMKVVLQLSNVSRAGGSPEAWLKKCLLAR